MRQEGKGRPKPVALVQKGRRGRRLTPQESKEIRITVTPCKGGAVIRNNGNRSIRVGRTPVGPKKSAFAKVGDEVRRGPKSFILLLDD